MARVLIAEDDGSLRRLFAITLEREGHEVVVASDGAAALAAFSAEDFDLVITDIMMPSVDGLQVLRTLRQAARRPKLIAISGNDLLSGTRYLEIAEVFGAVETLQKPFSNEELRETVRRVLGEEVATQAVSAPVSTP